MSTEPASSHSYASLTIGQLIGLNLARLYAWLVRFQTSGEECVPSDIAYMAISMDWQVHAFIRMLASAQLENAGYTEQANAMRTPVRERSSRRHEQAALSSLYTNEKFARADENAEGAAGRPRIGSGRGTPASTLSEPAQGYERHTPDEVIKRLEATIENFERAEQLAGALARIIVCALAYIYPEASRETFHIGRNFEPVSDACRMGLGPSKIVPVGRGPPTLSSRAQCGMQ